MALGAFLAGVLLAESEYRRELETDIEPFKGLLLGLFFIAVGMSIDFARGAAQPAAGRRRWWSASCCSRRCCCWAMARAMPMPLAERPVFIVLLAQGGEFGFVVFQAAAQARRDRRRHRVAAGGRGGAVDAADAAAAGGRSTAGGCRACWRAATRRDWPRSDEAAAGAGDHRRLRPLRPDRRPHAVRQRPRADRARPRRRAGRGVRRFGWRVFYGDATRLDLLRMAGAAQGARCWCVAIDDVEQSARAASTWHASTSRSSRSSRARATSRTTTSCASCGVTLIERETLDSALMSARSVLELLGWQPHQARNAGAALSPPQHRPAASRWRRTSATRRA